MKILNHEIDLQDFFLKVHAGASLLMLDYDGTLAPFVKERMRAHLYTGVKDRLIAIAGLKKIRTVIVSGRSLSELETLLDLSPLIELWGSHGCERMLPDGTIINAKIEAKLVEGLGKGTQACKTNVGSEWCEVKPYSVALHWRGMDPKERIRAKDIIEKLWLEICERYALEIHPFEGGMELRLKGWNKGNVVQELLKEIPEGLPIAYLGDDLTDEDAFKTLGNKGLKVLVRMQPRETLADILLIPPHELLSFLDLWVKNV